jgi:hypothetical protein
MTTLQITFDQRELGAFEQQHDKFIRQLRKQGHIVTKATGHEPRGQAGEASETSIHLLEPGIMLADTVVEIRRAAQQCLHGTLPALPRHLLVYGPQGQHLLELTIPQDQS